MTAPWHDPRVRRGMEALLKLRAQRIAAGDVPIGWKVAFGAKAVQEKLGISGPLVGFLVRSRALQSGGTAALAGWAKPLAEPEVAAHIGRDLPAGAGRDAAKAAIAAVGPAIELIDSEGLLDDVERSLSGNIGHRHVVLGPSAPARPEDLRCRVLRRGAEFARADDVQAVPGEVAAHVSHVADYLAAFGEKLRAKDIVICGSIVTPIPVASAEDSFSHVLEPVGEVSVHFASGAST
jgi:2-oxo-3-hexenedioate decarboxylase